MTTSESGKTASTSLLRDLIDAPRYYLGTRRTILLLTAMVALVGIGFGWNWLVAAGIAPILLTTLPCIVMCGLGLCMNRLMGSSSSAERTIEPSGQGRKTHA